MKKQITDRVVTEGAWSKHMLSDTSSWQAEVCKTIFDAISVIALSVSVVRSRVNHSALSPSIVGHGTLNFVVERMRSFLSTSSVAEKQCSCSLGLFVQTHCGCRFGAVCSDACPLQGSKANKDKTRPMQLIPPVDTLEKVLKMCLVGAIWLHLRTFVAPRRHRTKRLQFGLLSLVVVRSLGYFWGDQSSADMKLVKHHLMHPSGSSTHCI